MPSTALLTPDIPDESPPSFASLLPRCTPPCHEDTLIGQDSHSRVYDNVVLIASRRSSVLGKGATPCIHQEADASESFLDAFTLPTSSSSHTTSVIPTGALEANE